MLEFLESPYMKNYTDQEQLRILYAIGWYNTYTNKYNNIGINTDSISTDALEYLCNGNVDEVKFNWINKRSIPLINNTLKTAIEKSKFIAKYILQFALSFGTVDNLIMIISPVIAKIIINNNTTYNKLNIDQLRENGLVLLNLGTVGNVKTYIDLNSQNNSVLLYKTNTELNRLISDNKHIVTLSIKL